MNHRLWGEQSNLSSRDSKNESHSVVCDSLRHHGLHRPPGQTTGIGSCSLLQDLPNPGIEPRSPTLQEDSLPAEPQGKPIQRTEYQQRKMHRERLRILRVFLLSFQQHYVKLTKKHPQNKMGLYLRLTSL